ncbi:TPA: hypothetical protein ACH3X2_009854 [Trebouxia sp. C0005]
MRYCFNGIVELPLSDGEKIERFMSGLNAPLKRLMVTAPLGMGRNGKWLGADELMSYAVLQARALPNAAAISHVGSAAGSVMPKTASAGGQEQQKTQGQRAKQWSCQGWYKWQGWQWPIREEAQKGFFS